MAVVAVTKHARGKINGFNNYGIHSFSLLLQVGQGLRVKIANFGLSYDPQCPDYCRISSTKTSNTPVPLRWLAPESLRHGKFSVFSDVWSFGVLLWEVFSFGAHPYAELPNARVVEKILNLQVLSKPDKCPDDVHRVMLKCWNKIGSKRPLFGAIGKELSVSVGNLRHA